MKQFVYKVNKQRFFNAKNMTEFITECVRKYDLHPYERQIFSGMMTGEKDNPDNFVIVLYSLDKLEDNPYSLVEVMDTLYQRFNNKQFTFVRAPLELYYKEYQGMLTTMLNTAYYQYYSLMGLKKEVMRSILNESISYLFNHPKKNYYLHKHLIFKTYNNNLKKALRNHVKNQTISLNRIMEDHGDGSITEAIDLVADPVATALAYGLGHVTAKDYWDETLIRIRNAIIEDIGEAQYLQLLQRLDAKVLTNNDSQLIARYRREFNPKPVAKFIIVAKKKEESKNVTSM